MRPAHIQRCTYTEVRGGRSWQCRRADPHPDAGHDLPVDAEFGRVLHEQTPDWLAAHLRDKTILTRHLQVRLDALQAVAVDLAGQWDAAQQNFGPIPDLTTPRTRTWVARTLPGIARRLGYEA